MYCKHTLFHERGKRSYIFLFLGELPFPFLEIRFLQRIVRPQLFIRGSRNERCVVDVANNGFDVLVFGVLLQILELQFTEEELNVLPS